MSACQYVCFKFFDTLIDLINDLQSFIIIFNKSHSHQIENYQQLKTAYYIDWRYRISYFKKQSQFRFWSRSKSNSDESRTLYNWKKNNFDWNRTIVSYNSKQYDLKKKVVLYATKLIADQSIIFEKSEMHQKHDWKKVSTNYSTNQIISQKKTETNRCFNIWLIISAIMRTLILILNSLTN